MLTDHKLRQRISNSVSKPDDEISSNDYEESDQIISNSVRYFTQPVNVLMYPAKSYAVAIIYSLLIEKYFGIPLLESLSDPDLLYNNDPYFVPYDANSKRTYDTILTILTEHNLLQVLDTTLDQVNKTVECFMSEFYITPNPYFSNVHTS